MKKTSIIAICAVALLIEIPVASATIQYGSTNLQSNAAATTTQKVDALLNQVVKGELGASSTSDVSGIVAGAGKEAGKVNGWLQDEAGINLMGIVRAIGHFFVVIVGFVIDLVKKLL